MVTVEERYGYNCHSIHPEHTYVIHTYIYIGREDAEIRHVRKDKTSSKASCVHFTFFLADVSKHVRMKLYWIGNYTLTR